MCRGHCFKLLGVLQNRFGRFRWRLSDWISPDRFTNDDAGKEIDRLTVTIEELNERIKELEASIRD